MRLDSLLNVTSKLATNGSSGSAYKSSAADSLLAERGHIDNSHRMTDDMIAYVSWLISLLRTCIPTPSGPYMSLYTPPYDICAHLAPSRVHRQAYETRSEFGRQRTTISGINTRMQGVISTCYLSMVAIPL